MLFNSLEFLLFLPAVFALYWLLGARYRLQNLLVVAASYLFYGWWDWRFLGLIAFTSAWSYASGLVELRRAERGAEKGSKTLVALGMAVNLGILGYFKYSNFFIEQAGALLQTLGFEPHLPVLRLILPVGISFYTFQAMSYVVDVYRRSIVPTKDPVAFFAFISFFPQLVAGPIERAKDLLPQFLAPRRFDGAEAAIGCRQMLWGFFKKMVVADNCALVTEGLLNGGGADGGNGLAVWIGMLAFAFQVYGDFSGYSDIAIGCAKLFGVRLTQNFRFPYFARNIPEFWRRWHITLMNWFRDYLYFPLGGGRVPRWKKIRNVFAVFLISGFWHGASWNFVLWGGYYAVLMLPSLLRRKQAPRHATDVVAQDRWYPTSRETAAVLWTFFVYLLGIPIFRGQSLAQTGGWFVEMFNPLTYATAVNLPSGTGTAFALVGTMMAVDWVNRREDFGFARQFRCRWLRWLVFYAVLAAIFHFTPGSQNFVYFQF